jgi:putative transposase
MLLKYFHDTILAGHLGERKTFQKLALHFWWPKMQRDVFEYVKRCSLCQRAKPAQDTRVGVHSANPVSKPMERLFIDFIGPLTCTKTGNVAILVVVDGFSKFVAFHPVWKISLGVVVDYLEKSFPSLWHSGLHSN